MWQQKMNSKPLWDWNIISCYPYISLPILASCGSCVAPFLLSPQESNMILSGRRYKRVSSNYCIKHYKTLCPFLFHHRPFPQSLDSHQNRWPSSADPFSAAKNGHPFPTSNTPHFCHFFAGFFLWSPDLHLKRKRPGCALKNYYGNPFQVKIYMAIIILLLP